MQIGGTRIASSLIGDIRTSAGCAGRLVTQSIDGYTAIDAIAYWPVYRIGRHDVLYCTMLSPCCHQMVSPTDVIKWLTVRSMDRLNLGEVCNLFTQMVSPCGGDTIFGRYSNGSKALSKMVSPIFGVLWGREGPGVLFEQINAKSAVQNDVQNFN